MNTPSFENLSRMRPRAVANVKGDEAHSGIRGKVWFYQTTYGAIVLADIMGLPKATNKCNSPIFAFHMHEGKLCAGTKQDPFAKTKTHFTPTNCPHPYHAGDLPPLFGADGNALLMVLTNKFRVRDIVGKTVVVHQNPDDFTTQPSGNSGAKIACVEIKAICSMHCNA